MLYKAVKVVIITEKLISHKVCKILDEKGATGFTVVAAGGKGSRDKRSGADRTAVIDDFANVKIEVIVKNRDIAEEITKAVVLRYLNDYSGITYLEEVEILRPGKFDH